MNRLRVLKLGWEFPPLINGGLGIACLGLARALAKHVDLTVVVPQSSPEADFTEFDLRGLNLLSLETLKPADGRYRYESFAQVRNVPVFLDPYGDGEIANDVLSPEIFSETTAQQLAAFKLGDLYGPDLGGKVIDLLSMTDVYCMPSVSEPFGLSALEAAQFGIPAVISKQSGVAEVLKGALKADYWDVELMAEHINNLLTDSELRERVIEQAKLDIAASTWDAAVAKVMKVYEESVR